MKLTQEESEKFLKMKDTYMLTTSEVATILNCNAEELFRCYLGHNSHPEVVQAVREWIT